ncbi:MAG: hypothetical protein IPJ61_20350 [Tessaracoccus sp.]|uniref:hypothetical protein n=1 Tax=Tessaracoccus sp. TaxID=1971211 RepID=UPI001EC6C473|nr:hypothetical protein [Tessaracoccus sp.]MBK7823340.1 hypothetical protein [Tessaracoccus sp.]
MAHNLTETPTKGTPVNVADDTEVYTNAAIEAMAQPIADRLAWCEDALDTTGGNHPIKSVNALAALTGLAGLASGDVRIVAGYGLYRFTAGDTTTAFSPWVVTHASGRWFHATYSSIADSDVGATLATLTAGKLPVARHTNGIVRTNETTYTGTWGAVIAGSTSTAASWVDSTVDHIESSLQVGDIVEITVVGWTNASAVAPAYSWVRLKAIDDTAGSTTGPTTTNYDDDQIRIDGSTATQFHLRIRHVVTAAGQFQAILQLQANGADAARLLYPTRINAVVIRP